MPFAAPATARLLAFVLAAPLAAAAQVPDGRNALPSRTAAGAPLPAVGVAARHVDSLLAAWNDKGESPGVAIAVIRGSDTIAIASRGKANLEVDAPATPASVWKIGSITKQFTAAAILQLADAGTLSLTDTIGGILPDLPAPWRGVTVVQLLNHTSGIPSYTNLGDAWRRRWRDELTGRELLALTADKPMDFAPGTRWQYDNTGYVLLGMIIEAKTGRPWHEELARRFFGPLHLQDTRFCATDPVIPRRAAGYSREESGWQNAPFLAMSQPHAAGALCSTVRDLARWNALLHGGKVLPPDAYARMTTPTGAAVPRGYGFGLARDTSLGRLAITHGGGIHGFAAANLWVPSANLSVTVLTNGDAANPDRLALQLARAALGLPLRKAPPIVPLPAVARARYVGTYLMPLGPTPVPFVVAETPDGLSGQLEGQPSMPLLHYGSDVFGMAFDEELRLTFTIADGRAVKVTLQQGGRTIEGTRKP